MSIKNDKAKGKKNFSMKYKLMILFGLMVALALLITSFISIKIARNVAMEKVEHSLVNKANDTAEVIDARITSSFRFLRGMAHMPLLRETELSFSEKADYLDRAIQDNPAIKKISISDKNGLLYTKGFTPQPLSHEAWFIAAKQGKNYISKPYHSELDNEMIMVVSIPVEDTRGSFLGALAITLDGFWLTEQIIDIVIGNTGYCYILDEYGNVIAHKVPDLVINANNSSILKNEKPQLIALAAFEDTAIKESEPSIGFYDYEGTANIASFAKIPTTGWTVIIKAPIHEFMGSVDRMRTTLVFIGFGILLAALALVLLISRRVVKPIQKIAAALKNIAQGDGDLTVRLPVAGNDEVTEVSHYFNETIGKIGGSMQSVLTTSDNMRQAGENLASNMTETASSINQISANIEGVKSQVLNQSAGVTETSATMEEIIQTIRNLDSGISNQINTLQDLIHLIKDSDKTTAETKNILGSNDQLINELVSDSSRGKEVISASEQEVHRILEESGSLLEASSIIQNIASQTNLLAMNAAIEAAHAGDAGKGFAVVADEIRKLAEESSSQAKIITAALKNLSMEIESVSESSTNIGETFMSIFDKVNGVKKRSAEIMKIAETRKEQSDHLLAMVESVDTVTSEVKNGSAEMLEGGKQVAVEMRKLDELTRQITDSMNEMAAGAVQINNAVQEVNDLTQQNRVSIETLAGEVGKFKV